MGTQFAKMHGLGNDFMVIANDTVPTSEAIKSWANRHTGVGFDQLLLLSKSDGADVDFHYRIFNADGVEAEQCGNGVRCLAHYVREQQLSDKSALVFANSKGNVTVNCTDASQYTVDMGAPLFTPSVIPFEAEEVLPQYELDVITERLSGACERMALSVVSMGNPHAVIIVEDINRAPIDRLGPAISTHPRFAQQTNVGFMQILSPERIALRVFERGSGETLACGSGACAAVVAGRRLNLLGETVQVQLPGGSLSIQWAGADQPVFMTGPAQTVYHGEVI